MSHLPLVLVGFGGHAGVVLDAIRLLGRQVVGFTEKHACRAAGIPGEVRYLGCDDVLAEMDPSSVELVLGMGSIGDCTARSQVFGRLAGLGFKFASVIHPRACIAATVAAGDGLQAMAGSVVQHGCRIGVNVIVNTGAIIDHGSSVGDHVHVAPGATVCGDVCLGSGCHVGAGATVIQGIEVGEGAIVGAGAVVVRDVPPRTVVCGVPASREWRRG